MLKRTITGAVLALLLIPLIIYSDTVLLEIVISTLSFISVYEMLGCVGCRSKWGIALPSYILSIAAPAISRQFEYMSRFMSVYGVAIFIYLVIMLAIAVFSKGKVTLDNVSAAFTTNIYVVTAFSTILLLRERTHGLIGDRYGYYLMIVAFTAPWISDIFAYLTGRYFGRHKLIPDISPKKTVEGAIGGMFFCGVACSVSGTILFMHNNMDVIKVAVIMFAAGVAISVVSQIGDLVASFIKRRYGVKDYGFILPGHGGILDRYDSVLAVTPFLIALSQIVEIYNIL